MEIILKDCVAEDNSMYVLAKSMLKAMRARFAGHSFQKEYIVANTCDPRFKNIFCAQAAQRMTLLEFVHTELQRSAPPACDRQEPSTSVPSANKERSKSIWDSIEKLAMSSGQKQLHASSSIDEFRRYL